MKAWMVMPGVPGAGHVCSNGAWHPGRTEGCLKCEAYKPPQRPPKQPPCPVCGGTTYRDPIGFSPPVTIHKQGCTAGEAQ